MKKKFANRAKQIHNIVFTISNEIYTTSLDYAIKKYANFHPI